MDPLAYVFSTANAARRNLKDFASDPLAMIERQVDALRNTTRGQEAVVNDQGAGMREIPREEQIRRMTEGATDTLSGGLGVIKPKGGNWLSGRFGVEKQLEQLKKSAVPEYRAGLATPDELAQQPAYDAVNSFVDRQLTKYIKNDMASPTDPVRLMLEKFPEEKAQKLAQAEAKVKALRQKQEAQAATRGVPPEMLTRTRQDVLAAEEARDLIAENTGLHYTPLAGATPNNSSLMQRRSELGFPAEGMAQGDLARRWENLADYTIWGRPAKDFQLPDNLEVDPWLAKVDPEVPVYSADVRAGNLTHVVDELRNSLAEGRLTPEQVQKMPIDQAVRHVAEINALRAVEAKKARQMDMADMPVYKDYPEQGMSWRQLKSDDEEKLGRWLKQEGDAMAHCVGGYCEDVTSGQSNIYSLRDAKGNPYATIETGPLEQNIWDNDAEAQQIWDRAYDELTDAGYDPDTPRFETLLDRLVAEREAAWQAAHVNTKQQVIRQIKGPKNESPDPKYFPLIQDFVRSGQWSAIEDAQNAGLTPAQVQELLKGSQ